MSTASSPRALRRVLDWLPARIDRRIRVLAWLSFVAEVLIIGTGGAVRLTGSGLGCPTWPRCTADSLVNTPEMGIHGIIEFGNRTLTGVVGILALAVVVLMWRLRHERRVMFVLAVVVLGGIVAQAVVGGITVLTGLNPFIVGFHYIASVALVTVWRGVPHPHVPAGRAARARRARLVRGARARHDRCARPHRRLRRPHHGRRPPLGDAAAVQRNGFDAEILEHVHSWPGYALFALTLAVAVLAWRLRLPVRRWATALLAVEVVQIAVGLYQARNGLPELAVGVHMVLAALAAAAMTVVVLRLKAPVAVGSVDRLDTVGAAQR